MLLECGHGLSACQMWGLLHPKLLSGEGGYYLTMLASTIHCLKSEAKEEEVSQQQNVGISQTKVNNRFIK